MESGFDSQSIIQVKTDSFFLKWENGMPPDVENDRSVVQLLFIGDKFCFAIPIRLDVLNTFVVLIFSDKAKELPHPLTHVFTALYCHFVNSLLIFKYIH